ncbi:MAG: hypothetical protein K0Q53_160 [Massilibacillus sp.]|jgi:hypothetical protein|nr:hypothetical protein [Massilibacillus sp.]
MEYCYQSLCGCKLFSDGGTYKMVVDNQKLLDTAIELVTHKDSFELIKSIEKIAKIIGMDGDYHDSSRRPQISR